MARKLQIKRGKQANLPTLSEGEFGLTTDQKNLYLGNVGGNIRIATEADITAVNNQLSVVGKRAVTLVVGLLGTHTASEVDFLADNAVGADVAINAAIQALPAGGGSILIREGIYEIKSSVVLSKSNMTFTGLGNGTVLKRMFGNKYNEAIVNVKETSNGCTIEKLYFNGNKAVYNSQYDDCINVMYPYPTNAVVRGNSFINVGGTALGIGGEGSICSENYFKTGADAIEPSNSIVCGNWICGFNIGLRFPGSSECVIVSNKITDCNEGVYLSNGAPDIQILNNQFLNNKIGIHFYGSNRGLIQGNIIIRGNGEASDYTSTQYTILFDGINDNNLVANNLIMGKNYVVGSGVGNTFVNNKYN